MLIVNLLVNEDLLNAEFAFNQANSGNIIELCKKYLSLLTAYRAELYKLRGAPEINIQQSTPLARELTGQVRKAIRSAVEITTRERNKIEALLESLTAISGYDAAATFNRLKYKNIDDWEFRASGIRSKEESESQPMSIDEAIKTASLLRREAYLDDKTTFFKQSVGTVQDETIHFEKIA